MAMFYKIALFILMFNIALAMLNQTDIFGGTRTNINPRTDWLTSITTNTNTTFNPHQSQGLDILGGLLKGLSLLVGTLFAAITVFPMFYEVLGCSNWITGMCEPIITTIVVYLTVAVYFVYAIAIIQFLRGVSVKNME